MQYFCHIFNLWLVESADVEPVAMKDWLYYARKEHNTRLLSKNLLLGPSGKVKKVLLLISVNDLEENMRDGCRNML
jgi:hypothetical protein